VRPDGGLRKRRGRPMGSGSSEGAHVTATSAREIGRPCAADRVVAISFFVYEGPGGAVPPLFRVQTALGRLVSLRLLQRTGPRVRVLFGRDLAVLCARAESFDLHRYLIHPLS
jgi:hypothetical protein